MSLLDDVSIVVTPNGYKAGRLYGVLPVPTEGSEEITNYNLNGNFSDTSALHTWISAFGGSFAPSTGVNDGSIRITSNGGIRLNGIYMGVVVGKLYKVSVLASTNTGTALLNCSGDLTNFTLKQTVTTTPTTFDFYVTYSSYISFFANLTSNILTLDDISVKEWTASDMDVTRATAATRVDENGLVNYAEVLSEEYVKNGDFSNGLTDWSFTGAPSGFQQDTGSGIKMYSGSVTDANNALSTSATLNFAGTLGNMYKMEITASDFINGTTGSIRLDSVYDASNIISFSEGTQTVYFTAYRDFTFIQFFAGTSDATITVNSISIKEADLNNVPRIDYTGGGCPHILAEPQRTNLVTYSEDFSNWNNFRSTLTPNETTSPDGTENAYLVEQDYPNTSVHGGLNKSIAVTNGVEYTYSFFVKKKEYSFIELAEAATSSGNVSTWFDVENGVVGNIGAGSTAQIEDYGNGWYRCSITFTSAFTGGRNFVLYLSAANGSSTANIVGGAYIWGAQLEAGSYPTSYIKTSGGSVTRNGDIFTRDGISSLINSTEGVLFVEFKTLSETGTFRQFNLSKDNSNRIYITKRGDNGNLQCRMENPSGSLVFSFTQNTTNDFVKVAFRYGLNNFAVFIDGVNKNVTSTGNVFASGTLNTLEFDSPLSQPFFGKVRQLQVYDTALTDNQLIQLTGEAGTHFFESYSEMAETLTYTIQ